MKKLTLLKSASALLAFLALAVNSQGQTVHTATLVKAYAPSNNVFSSATASPNDLVTFSNAVDAAFITNKGGVFNMPSSPAIATGTTIFRGSNLVSGVTKQFQITSSRAMQAGNNSGGTFLASSGTAVTTTTAAVADYTLTFGPVTNLTTGTQIVGENVVQVGFVIISRTSAQYPIDVRATALFSDTTTNSAVSNIINVRGTNVFFGFTAPSNTAIVSVTLQSFSPGTFTPALAQIGVDDIGVISGITGVLPPPQILNVSPINYAIHEATNGIHFQVKSVTNIDPANISLVLNSSNVSNQLIITGDTTNRSVLFSNLLANQEYTMVIGVTNAAGSTAVTQTFYTATSPFVLYDSQGFTNDVLYPLGNLQAVTDGRATWAPHVSEPSQIKDIGNPQGKILERANTGASRADFLSFPPISSGTMIIEFDAWVSITSGRTFDICIQPLAGGTTMGSFLAWGEVSGKLAYFDNVNWLPIADLQTDWHHVKIINYLSGPGAGKYDVLVNGSVVAPKLPFRNAPVGSAFNQFRIQSANTGPIFEYGRIDNLVITAALEDPNAFPPPQINNLNVANYGVIKPSDGIHFDVASGLAISATNVTVLLDGTNVSASLVVTGPATNLSVSYNQLGSGKHTVDITATAASGTNTLSRTFLATDLPITIFDSEGFSSETIYPVGPLQAIQTNGSIWAPAAIDPGQIVDTGAAEGKVLRRAQVGADRIDNLLFPLVSSGILTIDLDVRVSVISARTLDFCLLSESGSQMASFLGWGTVVDQFAYYNEPLASWIGMTSPGTNWHHYTTINYLSGPYTRTFDLKVDGVLVGEKLPFRHLILAGTPVGRLRVGAIRGTAPGEYGDLDNLVMTVQPFVAVPTPVLILNPTRAGTTFTFSFLSQAGMNHLAQYNQNLGTTNWTTLQTIPGDGTMKTVIHTNPPSAALFYRINSQ